MGALLWHLDHHPSWYLPAVLRDLHQFTLMDQQDPPQTLSTASHEQLLASGNQAYHLLFVQKTILEGKLQQAE